MVRKKTQKCKIIKENERELMGNVLYNAKTAEFKLFQNITFELYSN